MPAEEYCTDRELVDRHGRLRAAGLSECGIYRYWLHRPTGVDNDRICCFVMLNPSTADAIEDDPTIRRCVAFARDWGYGVLSVRNLFPHRATDKKELLVVDDPGGGERGLTELRLARSADLVVCAWGGWVPFERDLTAIMIFKGVNLHCLKTNVNGSPVHPLYQPASFIPKMWKLA